MKISADQYVALTMVGSRVVYRHGMDLYPARLTKFDPKTAKVSLLYMYGDSPEYQAVGIDHDKRLGLECCWCHVHELTYATQAEGKTEPETGTEEPEEDGDTSSGVGNDQPGELPDAVGVAEGNREGSTDNEDPASQS